MVETLIGILDYRMGNLRSVQKAFEKKGHQARVLTSGSELDGVTHLVLPGVGAFADGMSHLREQGLDEVVRNWASSKRPLLGICLGMQLLFDGSEEGADSDAFVPGLGLVHGVVQALDPLRAGEGHKVKVPHMGWNVLTETRGPLFTEFRTGDSVYFVHAYHCVPQDPSVWAATTDHGGPVCAAVLQGNLAAVQYHPEKSQSMGLNMLDGFARWNGKSE